MTALFCVDYGFTDLGKPRTDHPLSYSPSDDTGEARVLSFIDHAHPVAAQFFNDAVVRDGPILGGIGPNPRPRLQLSQRCWREC